MHTDGSCRGNPGPGGWAWASGRDDYASGADARTTNQRMEVIAVIEALRANPEGTVEIVSDSTYVVKCFHDRWHAGWLRRGWKNSQGQPVANRDLWEVLIPLVLDVEREVHFSWVKGHSGDVMNDFVDALATEAADRQRGRSSRD
ncbi:MAG: ribonuclease HI [Acidobacteria bacterium]|nr:ribonuclease HI [Acidobacteriota bacterium]